MHDFWKNMPDFWENIHDFWKNMHDFWENMHDFWEICRAGSSGASPTPRAHRSTPFKSKIVRTPLAKAVWGTNTTNK